MPTQGFPYRDIPAGWFQIGWSDELGAPGGGLVKPLRYFARDLVMYRGQSGKVVLMDAYCRHMGAHLGHGGKVCGDEIACPYHGWRWAPNGENVDIPYSTKPSPLTMRSWHVREVAGLILAWHHPENAEPTWWPPEIPEAADPAYYPVYPHAHHHWADLKMPAQLVAENAVDGVHFKYVHGNTDIGETTSFSEDGVIFRAISKLLFGGGKPSTWLTPNGPMIGTQDFTLYGLGLILTRFPDTDQALEIDCATPIDANSSDRRTSLLVRRPAGETGDVPVGAAMKRIKTTIRLAAQDFPIWENMKYMERPVLTREEALPQLAMRRWAKQFYAGKVGTGDRSHHPAPEPQELAAP